MACDYHFLMSKLNPQYYSWCIEILVAYIEEEFEFSVNEFDTSLPRNSKEAVFGRVWYEEKRISLHCYCTGCALMSLLHEAGHVLHRKRSNTFCNEEKEEMADRLGREISDLLGFCLFEEWKEFLNYKE